MQINEIFWQLRDVRSRYVNVYGGRRSGKSVAVSQLLALRAAESVRTIVVMRKYATTIRLSVWPRIQAALEETIGIRKCRINKTDREIRLPNGSLFLFVGADDPQKLKSIEGVTDYWLEEANEFTAVDFDTLDAGLSADCEPPPQLWLTYNPIPNVPGFMHWIQERFLQVAHKLGELVERGTTAVLRTYYRHNVFCPPATRELLESYRLNNPQLYRMWGLGEFTTLEGVILDGNWDIAKAVPDRTPYIAHGLDFGFAHDPAAVVEIWGDPKREVWIRELVYETGLTNPQLSAAMDAEGIDKRSALLIADSAEPKSIAELQGLGWRIVAGDKGPDYKRAAAQHLRSLRIHYVEGATNAIKEAATWSWKRDRRQNILPIPEDGNDHTIDATIYAVMKFVGHAGPLGKTKTERTPVTAGYRDRKW